MTVEVLGTVLGTAIQGQIVGGAPDCPADLNGTDGNNGTNINMTSTSLEETVSVGAASFSPRRIVRFSTAGAQLQ